MFPGPPTRSVIQVREGSGFAAIQRGYGVIYLQEPLIGYDLTARTARRYRELPGYVGEFWTEGGPVRPDSWSPNRIILQVEPRQSVFINQNPGSWWSVNGHQPFRRYRCAETKRVFAANADALGRLELRIHPRGLERGLVLHIIGFVLIVVVVRSFK